MFVTVGVLEAIECTAIELKRIWLVYAIMPASAFSEESVPQSSKVELSCLGKGSVSYGLGADFSHPKATWNHFQLV